MATAIQRRRGNTAQHASFTGLAGELTIDTDKNTVVVHDGVTAGGYALARADEVEALGGADITAVVAGSGLTGGATSGNATINIGAGAGITVNADNVAVNTAYYDVTSGGTGWTGNLEPSANNTYSLGSPTKVWKDVYVGPNSLVIDGVELGISNGVLQFGGANVAVAGSASSNADTRALFSATDAGGDGSFSYNSATGTFTYTGPSASDVRAHFSAGTGITLTSGAIAVDSTIATKDYANTAATNAVAAVIDSAPATLDTLNELAAALGDDANFSTTITNSISSKLATADFDSTANTWIGTQATTALAEGTNLYFTAARARGNISVTDAGGDGSMSYDSGTGVITYTGPSASDVRAHLTGGAGLTYSSGTFAVGAGTGITVNADDVAVNVAYVRGQFSASGDISYNASTGVFSFTNDAGDIESVTAGSGLTGGGITGAVTLNIGAGTGITVNADDVAVNATYIKGLFSATDSGGDGSFSYSDGVFTYTGPSASDVRAHFSAGTGVTITSGAIAIGQAVGTGDSVSFAGITGPLTGNVTGTVSSLANHDTADLAEGTNLYFTAARARGNISVTDAGGDGSLAYDSGTGVITYTGPSASDVRAHFSAGTGITVSSGVIAVDSTIATKDYANTAASAAVSAVIDAAPGTLDTLNELAAALGDDANFSTTITNSIAAKLATADFDSTANTWIGTQATTALAEGTNLYFTAARARGNISVTDAGGDGSLSYNSGTGVITYTGPSQAEANTRIDARLSGGTGITYTSGVIATTITQYTDALAKAAISVTDAGGDGSLAYNSSTGVITYTGPSATDVRAHFTAGTGVTLSSGQISIGQAVGTSSNVSFNNVTATGNFFGNVTGNVSGNAGTATTLATARTIGGVSFNGSADINLPGVNTAGNQDTTGNAATATKWATARTITLTGDVTGVSGNFDGSGNLSFATTIAANSVALGTDTTGNYVASVANGAYITGGAAGSEGATLTLAVDATTTATASKVAARDASGDLYANIFQGTASSARYADLAERYEADAILEPGTVVCFGGEKEITACDHENDHAVAGVVSTDPAYMMNSAAGNNDTHPYIALTGRVPVKVVGPVAKGDLLVASEVKGHAMANNNAKAGTIIGKAIGSSDSGEGVVEALINLM